MKSFEKLKKEYTNGEIAESFIFPGPAKVKDREELLEGFRKYRKDVSLEQSRSTKVISYLLQLKFLVEDFSKTDL